MKGLIRKALAGSCGTALLALTGCVGTDCTLDDVMDPCYPQRYWATSKHELNEAMAPQMMNGHILDQTVFDDQFEVGSDRLTVGGLEHLKYIARRRPHADPVVFLQTAQDVVYDPAVPDLYPKARADLNAKRIVAIQKFLVAYTAGGQDFRVVVHDPHEVGQSAIGVRHAVNSMYGSYTGTLGIGSVGGGVTAGGTAPTGAGGGATATATAGGAAGAPGGP